LTVIAKRMKLSYATIKRYCQVLDEEVAVEPQYSEERLENLAEFKKRYEEQIEKYDRVIEMALAGSQCVEQIPKSMSKKEIAKIKSPEQLLAIMEDDLELTQVTLKRFGPPYQAIASLLKGRLDTINSWAKLLGLMIEREVKETRETERTFGVVIVPARARDAKEWEENFVLPYRDRKVVEVKRSVEKNEETH
ncbi:MAG: hypothetical protein ACFFCW_26665, partial [Candidatus Hodarchaeota archaeon]